MDSEYEHSIFVFKCVGSTLLFLTEKRKTWMCSDGSDPDAQRRAI